MAVGTAGMANEIIVTFEIILNSTEQCVMSVIFN